MKILLVFDWLGEMDLDFYLIENAPKWLTECDRSFVNSANNSPRVDELLGMIVDAICENPDHYSGVVAANESGGEIAGTWVDFKQTSPITINGEYRVVVTGFIP